MNMWSIMSVPAISILLVMIHGFSLFAYPYFRVAHHILGFVRFLRLAVEAVSVGAPVAEVATASHASAGWYGGEDVVLKGYFG